VENDIARREPPLRGWTGYPVGFVAGIAVTTAAVAAHGSGHPWWTFTAVAGAAAAVAAGATLRAGLATAAFCWALYAGFVLGRHGELALTGESLRAALLLAAIATLAVAVATAVRARGRVARPVAVPVPRAPAEVAVLGHAPRS
jgi:hypothetical protein